MKKRIYGKNYLSLLNFRRWSPRTSSRWHTVLLVRTSPRNMHVDLIAIFIEDLTSKKRYADAGQVLLGYAEDVREAVIALVQGNQFSEARRIVSYTADSCHHHANVSLQIALHECPELLEEIVDPAVLEARAQIAEDLTEMREQLQKQVARIRELRIKKVEEPGNAHFPHVPNI